MNFLKFRLDNQIGKILKVDSIKKKKNTKAELFLSVFVIFWTFLDDHDPTESFFFLLCVNCYLFLEKRVKWFSVAFSRVWNSVFLNWLLPKVREPGLLCYLTTGLVEKSWVYAFHKGIWMKVNTTGKPGIWTRLSISTFCTDTHYATYTSIWALHCFI